MEYGSYDDLLDSVRSLELSQSVLESTVRALDGDYAIYFESLDKSISALKSALNRSRDEIEDLVQVLTCPTCPFHNIELVSLFSLFFSTIVALA